MLPLSIILLDIVAIGMVSGGTLLADSLTGYELLFVSPQTEAQLEFINYLDVDGDYEFDFWTPPMVNTSGQILVPPGALVFFKAKMQEQGIPWAVNNADVDKLLGESINANMEGLVGMSSDTFHKAYHSYDEIKQFLYGLVAKHPRNAKVDTLPYKTYDGNYLYRIKLTGQDIGRPKKAIVIEGGIHAREWIAPAATLFAIDKLLEGYHGGNVIAKYMLNKYDWHFVPLTNPDGYTYTRSKTNPTKRRLWRKNRRLIDAQKMCYGVDLNRNFDSEFGLAGIVNDSCSRFYPGERAFSEKETQNIKYLVDSLKGHLAGYLGVHSYSQFILVPWGYKENRSAPGNPSNFNEMIQVGELMARAIKTKHGKIYQVGLFKELLKYAASGISNDWALKANPGIYSMTIELRPSTDDPGFLLPADQIIDTGEELLVSMEVFARNIHT